MNIYQDIAKSKQRKEKKLAVLIDPDKIKLKNLDAVITQAVNANVDYFLVGGSLIMDDALDHVIHQIQRLSNIPAILFPGNTMQINRHADAILLLSLISGRNPEHLIGNHVIAAPYLRSSNLEVISTGYILIDGGVETTVSYISGTKPIPADKAEIIISTALAGQMLGLKQVYLDAGSGAKHPIHPDIVSQLAQEITIPIIVGGGIRTPEIANRLAKSGADIIVVGNAFESHPELILDMSLAVHQESRNSISTND